jgi:hypothetical protein
MCADTCAEQLQEILSLRTQLYDLERQSAASHGSAQPLLERMRAEALELRLRIRSEQSREGAKPGEGGTTTRLELATMGLAAFSGLGKALDTAAATTAHAGEFVDGAQYDMDRDEADAEDDHRLSLPDSFDGGNGEDQPWMPRTDADFHFV